MTASSPWRRLLAVLAAAAALSVLATACGSDDSGDSGDGGATTVAPEDVIVPDSQVTAGLNQTTTEMKALEAGVADGTATQEDYEATFTEWTTYEGTIKQNDVEAYLALEDALAGMQKAINDEDAEAATQAVSDFEAAAGAYLAEHP